MTSRVSFAVAIGIALPMLLAGTLAGIFLRSRWTPEAGSPAMRPAIPGIQESPGLPPAPASSESGKASSSAPDAAPAAPTPLRPFGTLWRKARQTWPKDDPERWNNPEKRQQCLEIQKAARPLRKMMTDDPEGFLAELRSPENEGHFRGLLSLLCQFSGPDGGSGLFPLEEIPAPVRDAVRELLLAGTPNQKLGVLNLIQREAGSSPFSVDLIGKQALVEQCTGLLADADPRLRVGAVGVLQAYAPLPEDHRFGVLREAWQASADIQVRRQCLSLLGQMQNPEAREFLLKGIRQIASDASLAQDLELGQTAIHALEMRMGPQARPEDEEHYAAICSSALRTVSSPQMWNRWLQICVSLPLTRAVPILEQGAAFAPTPALQDSANRILAKIRAGETRDDRLRWDKY